MINFQIFLSVIRNYCLVYSEWKLIISKILLLETIGHWTVLLKSLFFSASMGRGSLFTSFTSIILVAAITATMNYFIHSFHNIFAAKQ